MGLWKTNCPVWTRRSSTLSFRVGTSIFGFGTVATSPNEEKDMKSRTKEHVGFIGKGNQTRVEIPKPPFFTFRFLFFSSPRALNFYEMGVKIHDIRVAQGQRGTQEELEALGSSSDKVSTTGWQAHDGRGSACGCHAAYLLTARPYMGRVWSNNDGRYTTSRALRRERVGPRESPAVEDASRVQVVSINRYCQAL